MIIIVRSNFQSGVKNGYIIRPYLGAELYIIDQFVTARYKLSVNKGVFVIDVAFGSPADKAGLRASDVITMVENKEISDAGTQAQLINSYQIGQKIKITYWPAKLRI